MKKILFVLFALLIFSACSTEKEEEYFNNAASVSVFFREKLVNKTEFKLKYLDVVNPTPAAETSFDYIIKIEFEYLKPDGSPNNKIVYAKITDGKFKESDFSSDKQKGIQSNYELAAVTPYRLNVAKVNEQINKMIKNSN